MIRWLTIPLLAAPLLALIVAGTALARPGNGAKAMQITLDCDNGQSYEAVVAGKGRWAPAHVVGSKTRIQPTAFLSFEGIHVDEDGVSHDQVMEEPEYRGNGKTPAKKTIITCDFSVSSMDEKTGESFTGTGVIQGYIKNDSTEAVAAEQQGKSKGKSQGKGKNK